MPDGADEQHTRKLAKDVERYWRKRGYPDVVATVERVATSTGEGFYAIKSNLVNGLPQGFRGL